MIQRQTVLFLGLSQLVCWGISYYLIAVFGKMISTELTWSGAVVYGGFSAALVLMAITSPFTGRLIDTYGGRFVMTVGSFLLAFGCSGLAFAHSIPVYYLSWMVLGIAMRLTLYDAAFASLVHIGGTKAKRPISQITLLGGLASTVFWPIGFFLADLFGWRGALGVYAVFALLTVPLHLAIPKRRVPMETAAPKRLLPVSGKQARKAGGRNSVCVDFHPSQLFEFSHVGPYDRTAGRTRADSGRFGLGVCLERNRTVLGPAMRNPVWAASPSVNLDGFRVLPVAHRFPFRLVQWPLSGHGADLFVSFRGRERPVDHNARQPAAGFV